VKFGHLSLRLFAPAFLLAASAVPRASAQALYTATQQQSLSAWGGATGTFVNLSSNTSTQYGTPVGTLPGGGTSTSIFNSGKNLGISAGINLRIWQYHGLLPSIEIRGTYPFAKGSVAAEENAMVGLKIERQFGRRYHVYGDFFFGRGEIQYQGRGYLSLNGFYLYQQSYSNVLSPGAGVDIDLTHHYAVKVDAQLWHQDVPVTTSGTLNSLAVTVGAIYRFDFNPHYRAPRKSPPINAHPANTAQPPQPVSTSQ